MTKRTIENVKMEVIMIPVGELTPYEKNVKQHPPSQVKIIAESIKQFGFADPIGIWGEKNIIVEGHGRLLAAKKLKMKKVPCIRLDHLNDEERRAYTLAHNRSQESTNDIDLLKVELNDIFNIDMAKLGFEDFVDITKDDFIAPKEEEEDDFVEPFVKPGDIWHLGRHRLLCGDADNAQMVGVYMASCGVKKADMAIVDPYMYENVEDWIDSLMANTKDFMKEGATIYSLDQVDTSLDYVMRDAGFVKEQIIYWDRMNASGSKPYSERVQPIIMARAGGKSNQKYWGGAPTETDMIEAPKLEELEKEELVTAYKELLGFIQSNAINLPTGKDKELGIECKPVELYIKLMRNSCPLDGAVLDFTGGNGTSIMAGERCARTVFAVEREPAWCSRIVKRFFNYVGDKSKIMVSRGGAKYSYDEVVM
jgi:DNA modification methylase